MTALTQVNGISNTLTEKAHHPRYASSAVRCRFCTFTLVVITRCISHPIRSFYNETRNHVSLTKNGISNDQIVLTCMQETEILLQARQERGANRCEWATKTWQTSKQESARGLAGAPAGEEKPEAHRTMHLIRKVARPP